MPQAEREALLSQGEIGRDFLAVTKRQPFEVVKELFENEHVQLLFLFKGSLFGTWLVDTLTKTSPMGSVIRAFDLRERLSACQGGSFNLARGADGELHRRRRHLRSRRSSIERIVIEGGAPPASSCAMAAPCARAVRGRDARRASDVRRPDRPRRNFPPRFWQKIDGFQYTRWTLFGLHLALHEPALRGRELRSEDPPHAEMEHRRRDDGRTDDGASGREAGRVPRIVQFGSGR